MAVILFTLLQIVCLFLPNVYVLLQLRNDGWQLHTGMIFDMAFTPSGDKLITVSIDQSIIVWKDLTNKNKHIQFTRMN